MDFRHLIVTCLFSMLRLSFETQKIKENYAILTFKPPLLDFIVCCLISKTLKKRQMLHVYHYLTNIINQTVLPLHKKAGGNDFLRLLPIVCYWYLFDNT